MGLFNRFFKKKEEPAKKQEEKKNYLESSFPFFGTLPDGTKCTLMDFKVKKHFRHRDDTVTVAVMARIVKGGIDDTVRPDDIEFISFEIDPNQPVTKEICQKLLERYPEAQGKKYGEYQRFLGKLTEQTDGSITREDGSTTVLRHMDDLALESLKQREAKKSRDAKEFSQQIHEIDEKKRQTALEEHKKAEELEKKIVQERLMHPYFTRIRKNSDREEYNGINLKTGKIMRLREVNKHLKDNETYLYTAFRVDVEHDYDAEMNPEEYGYPIAFETDFKLEDIPEMGDFDVTRWILSLLGTNTKELNSQKLNYIGKISRDGLLTRNKESDSKIINDKLQELQDYFKQKLAERFEGR